MDALWLVPLPPLLGFLALAAAGRGLGRRGAAWIGTGAAGLAALAAWLIALRFAAAPPAGAVWRQTLWTWMEIEGFRAAFTLHLDPLTIVVMLVVASVGFLVHLYSGEFMAAEEGYRRYFAYLNLFVAAMLLLVLAGDLLLLFVGWEAVGLCSYLLVGFRYRDPANGAAARKAFIVTRAGDSALLLGIVLLVAAGGSADIATLLGQAGAGRLDSAVAGSAAALLLAGALGKSAQPPLQIWLPDAMAGPTPVSALIHAATMVAAGVYLLARLHPLYLLAPAVQDAVALAGTLGLLLAGCSALVQHDLKRVLAYSTISQLGYMFLALGLGAWTAAIFHFMTHAFFKALLFLAAGAVIHALDGEHDIFRMGGLRRRLPLAFGCFVVGGASLAALPLAGAGYFSKELILQRAWAAPMPLWWAAAWLGALLTALYTFRLIFLVFGGRAQTPPRRTCGWRMRLPLLALAALSLTGGLVETPPFLGGAQLLSAFLAPVFPAAPAAAGEEAAPALLAALAALGGAGAAAWLFLARREVPARLAATPAGHRLHAGWAAGWGFDLLYEHLLLHPYVRLAAACRRDFFDAAFAAPAALALGLHRLLGRSQNGRLRWYAAGLAAGAILLVGLGGWR